MRMTRGWTGLRTTVIALGFAAWTASGRAHDTIINYSTSGTVESDGVVGDPVISFNSVQNASFNAPSAFSLGEFQITALQGDSSTTYNHTPFSITYLTNKVNDEAVAERDADRDQGVPRRHDQGGESVERDGVVRPDEHPQVPDRAVRQRAEGAGQPAVAGAVLERRPDDGGAGRCDPDDQPDPEPTTVALFLTTLAGLGLRHRLRAGRPA